MHGPQYVLLGRLAHRILLVIGENNHILALVVEVLDEVARHVPNIVDAAPELTALTEIVDTDKQGFSPARTGTVFEGIALRGSVAEVLRTGRRRWRGAHVAMAVCVRVHRRQC